MPNIMPPSLPRLPDPGSVDTSDPHALREYLTLLTSSLAKHLQQRPTMSTAANGRLYQSPSGRTFNLTIDDDGNVVATPFGSAQDRILPP